MAPRARLAPTLMVLALGPLGCSDAEVAAAACPAGSVAIDGACRRECGRDDECRADQVCVAGVCGDAEPGMAEIRAFEVGPREVASGSRARVGYAVVRASRVQITVTDGSNVSQSILDSTDRLAGIVETGPLTEDVTVTLAAFGAGGQPVTRNADVAVESDRTLAVQFFTANPNPVAVGAPTTLAWQVRNGVGTVRITEAADGAVVLARGPLAGTHRTPVAATTTYVLSAEGAGGQTTEAMVTVTAEDEISGPTIEALTMTPGPIDEGDGALVAWRTRDAVAVRIRRGGNNGVVLYESAVERFVADGAFVVLPAPLFRSFTLEAVGADGASTVGTRSLQVDAPPPAPRIINFQFTPEAFDPFEEGAGVEVSWNVQPNDAEVTLRLGEDAFSNVGDGQIEAFVPSGQTVPLTLEAVTPGGRAEAFGQIWDREAEREPNDTADLAQSLTGYAIQGSLPSSGSDRQDRFLVRVVPGGRVVARMLASTMCPPRTTLELWRAQVLVASSRPLLGCPRIEAERLDGGSYELRLERTSSGDPFDYELAVAAESPRCGDGEVDPPQERCDDGNLLTGDGCSPTCQVEPGYDWTPSVVGGTPWTPAPRDAAPLELLAYPEGGADPADEGFAVVPLPFPFRFYGRVYEGLVVHANGYVSLLPDLAGAAVDPRAPAGPGRPNAVVAAVAADLRWPAGQTPRAWLQLANDTRVVWVDFEGAVFVGQGGGRIQARLGVSDAGNVVLRYGAMQSSTAFVAGLEDHDGANPVAVPGCPMGCVPGRLPTNVSVAFTVAQ